MSNAATVAKVPNPPGARALRRVIYKQINLAIHQLQLADEEVDHENHARARGHLQQAQAAVAEALERLRK